MHCSYMEVGRIKQSACLPVCGNYSMKTLIKNVKSILPVRTGLKNFESENVRRIWRGAAWAMSGQVVGRGCLLLSGLICARLLGVTGFGQFGMIRSTLGVFSVLAGFGLGVTATCYVARYKGSEPEKAGEIIGMCNTLALIMGTVMAVSLFFLAPFMARTSLADPNLYFSLQIAAAMVFTGSLVGAQLGALAGFEGFRSIAVASAVEGISLLLVMAPLVYFFKVNGAIIALVISQILKFIVLKHMVNTHCREYGVTISKKILGWNLSILKNYSFPAFLCGFMYGPSIWVLNQIVVSQPGGYEMLGIMSAADQWRNLIMFAPGALGTVVMPALASLRKNEKSSYRDAIKTNMLTQFLIACCVALPVALSSSYLVELYGASFKGLSLIIVISCGIAVITSIGAAAGNAIMTNRNIWPNFLLNLIWAVCLIASGYFLIKFYGVIGIAISYLAAYLLHSIMMYAYALGNNENRERLVK